MAFTSIDDIISEIATKSFRADWYKQSGAAAHVAGNTYDLSLNTGSPPANTYAGTALNSVAPDETATWAIKHGGNVTSDTKVILNAMGMPAGSNSAPGILMLVDIALYYPGIDLKSTALQTMVQAAALSRYTSGVGLRPFIVTTVQSGGTPASTPRMSVFNYRNQSDADAALTGVGTFDFVAGAAGIPPVSKIVHATPAANNCGPFLPLNNGDTGIKRVNTFQLSTAYTGSTTTTAAIVLCKPLLSLPLPAVGVPSERSFFAPSPLAAVIPDGAALAWLYMAGAATAANSNFQGNLDLGWG